MTAKFSRGERLAAAKLNRLVDRLSRVEKLLGPGKPKASAVARMRNGSGSAVAKGQVLGIDSLSISPKDSEGAFLTGGISLVGSTPSLPDHEVKYAVALEPIADGKIGRVALDGLVRVRLNLIDKNDKFATVVDGSATLESNWFGSARIIAVEEGDPPLEEEEEPPEDYDDGYGERWAVVRLNDPSEMKCFGKVTGETAGGSSGTIKVYRNIGSSYAVRQRATGEDGAMEDVTLAGVWHPPPSADVSAIPADAWVQAERDADGNWMFDVEYCPAE